MTTAEFIALVAAIGVAIKSFDWIAGIVKNYLAHRKEQTQALSQTEIDKTKLELLAKADVTQINRADFQAVKDAAVDMMRSAMEQREIAQKEAEEEEREMRHRQETEFQSQISKNKDEIRSLVGDIGEIKSEHKSCNLLLEQFKANLRFVYNNLNIAYWTVAADGKCTINQVFNNITGLDGEAASSDGWLKAVAEEDRARVTYLWRNFRENFSTHTAFHFHFCHVETKVVTEVFVELSVLMKNGFEVHEYTAQTKPLKK